MRQANDAIEFAQFGKCSKLLDACTGKFATGGNGGKLATSGKRGKPATSSKRGRNFRQEASAGT